MLKNVSVCSKLLAGLVFALLSGKEARGMWKLVVVKEVDGKEVETEVLPKGQKRTREVSSINPLFEPKDEADTVLVSKSNLDRFGNSILEIADEVRELEDEHEDVCLQLKQAIKEKQKTVKKLQKIQAAHIRAKRVMQSCPVCPSVYRYARAKEAYLQKKKSRN